MEHDPVDLIVEPQIEEAVQETPSRPFKSEPMDTNVNTQGMPFIQRVVSVPPSVGSAIEVWQNQYTEPVDTVTISESANAPSSQQSEQSNDSKQYCCLLDSGKRCHRVAGNASFSRKINKMASQKGLKLCTDINCKHIYICDHHKNLIQRVRPPKVARRQQQASDDENTNDSFTRRSGSAAGIDAPTAAESAANRQLIENIVKSMSLQVLRRYRQVHKISGKAGNKIQLQELVVNHFESVPVNESDVVLRFFRVLRTNSNKYDQQLPSIPTTPVPTTPLSIGGNKNSQGSSGNASSKNGVSASVPSTSSHLQQSSSIAVVPSFDSSVSDGQQGNSNNPSSSWS